MVEILIIPASRRNAIQVKNISNVQIGHIPRNVASKLAPLMDRGIITVEGVMHEGNCKRTLSAFYSPDTLNSVTGSHYTLSM